MLLTLTSDLAGLLQNIESNNLQISSHKTNASVANAAALAAYLLTSNSKNKTTRTIGQVGAVGGVIYGSGETNKADNLKRQNLQLIDTGVKLVTERASQSFRTEPNQAMRADLLSKALDLSMHLDVFVKEHLSRVKKMHTLTKTNRSRLLSLQNESVFGMKLKLNGFFLSVDQSIDGSRLLSEYQNAMRAIQIQKLEKEAFLMIICMLGCALAGLLFLFAGIATTSVGWVMLALSILIYLTHTFFPWLPETKKLRVAVMSFSNNLNKTTEIQNINYR